MKFLRHGSCRIKEAKQETWETGIVGKPVGRVSIYL
jgi:hypothetical protein